MPKGYLSLILHWHLPFVRHPEYERFLEEDWLFEAITETYIPLLSVFESLEEDGVPFRLTVSVSPTLAEMLKDGFLQQRYLAYVDRLIELAGREVQRTKDDPMVNRLAEMYLQRARGCRQIFVDRYHCNLLDRLIHFQKLGALDLVTSSATHCFLPLFELIPQAVRAQIDVAVRSHIRTFGTYPEGFWLPECGYYPGVEKFCKEQNLGFLFLETHGVLYGSERPRHGVYAPVACPNGTAAFGRDPESARAVWSSEEGYPGDPVYREFYRDIGFELPQEYLKPFMPDDVIRVNTGIKYYAITGSGDQKRVYSPKAAEKKVQEHTEHFWTSRIEQIQRLAAFMDRPPLIVCPFDAELFGHWWFEGPQWLDLLLRRAAACRGDIAMITPSEYLKEHPQLQVSQPCFSSWGNKGYAEVWLEGSNDWIYKHLHQQAQRMAELVRRFPKEKGIRRRALNQAFREMLLAQASDWAFIMKTGTFVPYAVRRTCEHVQNFTRIYDSFMSNSLDQEWLIALEGRNNLFKEIDYRTFIA